jgi:hypothetical protein
MLTHLNNKPVDRQVLLFYTEQGQAKYEKQQKLFLPAAPGMKERDVLVESYNARAANDAIFNKWHIDRSKDFTFILIGRDGGEKYRSHECVTTEHLFALIDAMPMRKNEQRRSGKK